MGGCRCTYRGCTSRSDGSTHLFHYPVFDKVRCHQWLVNAEQMDLIKLKLSQLKNRVVCQHHFKDEDFMNYKKEKLKPSAVPTIDGPFCKLVCKVKSDNSPQLILDYTDEPKSYCKLKYNTNITFENFLKNEQPESETFDFLGLNNREKLEGNSFKVFRNQGEGFDTLNIIPKPLLPKSNTQELHKIPKVIKEVNNQIGPKQTQQKIVTNNSMYIQKTSTCNNTKFLGKDKKIQILSQKIIEPVQPLQPLANTVSPSQIIVSSKHKQKENTALSGEISLLPLDKTIRHKAANTKSLLKVPIEPFENNNVKTVSITIEQVPVEKFDSEVIIEASSSEKCIAENKNDTGEILTPNEKSDVNLTKLSTNKFSKSVTQNRAAIIEAKRKFNLMLRDALEAQVKSNKKSNQSTTSDKSVKEQAIKNVGNYLSEEPTLPNIEQYTLASIESRMKRMEDLLLRKIDQNSQKIVELKTHIAPSNDKKTFAKQCKRSVSSQSNLDEETHKKHLYQEISKYLSPEANNLIYEELFINKFGSIVKGISSPKRRKRR